MGREILFRGKRKDNGEWIEGGYAEHGGKVFIVTLVRYMPDTRDWDTVEYYENNPHYNSSLIEVIPETACQYSGLTDNTQWEELSEGEKEKFLSELNRKENRLNTKEDWKGRKIFEGDILRFVNHINNNEWLCSIEFLEGSFICRYIYEDGEFGEYNHFTSWHEKVKWEVIGSIFDNPELLNQ